MFARFGSNSDLIWALAIQAVVCWAVFCALSRWTRGWSNRALDVAAAGTLALLFLFIGLAWDRVWLAQAIPLPNLVVLGNAFPVLTVMLAANIWRRVTLSARRQTIVLAALAATGLLTVFWPVAGRAPQCGDDWLPDGTCLQTTRFTCSAACAATLLRAHGIAATEQEMADLCLTRRGTTWMGLFRGLKKKTAGTPWDVTVAECSVDDLRRMDDGPMILRVGLDYGSVVDESCAVELGWHPGLRHSVVLRGFVAGERADVSDPTPEIGREFWTLDELRQVWQGQAIRLVRRAP